MVKRFHIYGALFHLALKVYTFTGPYYIFTFRGATTFLFSDYHNDSNILGPTAFKPFVILMSIFRLFKDFTFFKQRSL